MATAAAASHRSCASMNRSSSARSSALGSPADHSARRAGRCSSSSRELAGARCSPRRRSSRGGTPSRWPASRARRGRSTPRAVSAAGPAWRRGTRARLSPARRRPRPAGPRSAQPGPAIGPGTAGATAPRRTSASPPDDANSAEACRGKRSLRCGRATHGTMSRRRSCRGCATRAATSPARRPPLPRTRRASGSSGRAAHAGAVL